MKKKLVIFTDMGDTIVDEGSQVLGDNPRLVLSADCIPGAKETLKQLHDEGHPIAMVADGLVEAFANITKQHDLDRFFDAKAISSEIGETKPSPKMFAAAMERMGLTDTDKPRVVMIGNNINRDVVGANRFGIRSILITWSPRYDYVPKQSDEKPDYTVSGPEELLALIHRLETEL